MNIVSVNSLPKIRKANQNRANGNETVVQPPGIGDVAGLESQLEATASHTKAHSIKIDMVR
jgi:hypothetical protein